jgi:hypothetical protein
VSSASNVTSFFAGLEARLRSLRERRREVFSWCPEDRYWFRPLYTDGSCPLCGRRAEEVPPAPLLVRMDRFVAAVGVLAAASVAMGILVVITYIKA